MQYTMVTEYVHGDITVWILTRDERKNLEAAFPMPGVGMAVAVIAAGKLGAMTSATEGFYESLALGESYWDDYMVREHDGGEGHFPCLRWMPLH